MQLLVRRRWILVISTLAAAALAVVSAKGAARVTEDPVVWGLAGWTVPADFGIFLVAADAVVHGQDPYPQGELLGRPHAYYVYPPALALLITPLTALPAGKASTIWTLLGVAAVIGTLLALGVVDWRCHALALLLPSTREALEYGAIGTFLALLVALAWRYRNRVSASAAATAGAVVLKLFLWPLVAWHVFTGRVRTAVSAAGTAVAIALLSWAVIGFHGLLDYPRVLRDLADLEAAETYSPLALGTSLGTSRAVAQTLAIAVGVALLLAAWLVARRSSDQNARDARSLVLVIAAAFALTPILWHHYLVLLLVPVALARPRLSLLWLVPAADVVPELLGWYGGWAEGTAPRAGVVALVAATTVGALLALRDEPMAATWRLRSRRPARASQ